MARESSSPEEHVSRAAKQIDFSFGSLDEFLSENGGNFSARAKIRGRSDYVRIVIRVRRADMPVSWAMAILLNDQRVGGIDWEARVEDHRGKQHNCQGWHQHIWKVKKGKAKDGDANAKECLPKFNPKTIREFIVVGFGLLNVQLKKEGRHEPHQLPFD